MLFYFVCLASFLAILLQQQGLNSVQEGALENNIYLDVGTFFWYPLDVIDNNGCIDWNSNPPQIIWSQMMTTFAPMFQFLAESAGVHKIYLSFAQIGDIPNLVSGHAPPTTSADRIADVNSSYNYPINGAPYRMNPGLISALIGVIRECDLQVIVSFGGAAAGNSQDWTFNSTMNVQDQANNLIVWAQSNGISGFDFDIENTLIFESNVNADITTFFSILSSNPNFELTIALLGNSDQRAINLIPYFSKVNLMLYSSANGPQYVTSAWISQWLMYPQISTNSSKLSVGFDTDIVYENSLPDIAGGSCGNNPDGSYTCPVIPLGTNRGTAAYYTYQQALNPLLRTSNNFGPTFWWADSPQLWMNFTSSNSETLVNFWKGIMDGSGRDKKGWRFG